MPSLLGSLPDPLGIFRRRGKTNAKQAVSTANRILNDSKTNKVDYSQEYGDTLGADFHDFYSQYANDQATQSYLNAFDDRGRIDPAVVAVLADNDPKKVRDVIGNLQQIQSTYRSTAVVTRRLDDFINDPKKRATYLRNAQTPEDVLKKITLGQAFNVDGGRLQTGRSGLSGAAANSFFDQFFDAQNGGLDFGSIFTAAQVEQLEVDAITTQQEGFAQQEAERLQAEAAQKTENIRIFNQYKDIYEQQATEEYEYLTKQLNIELPAIEDAFVAQIAALDNRIRHYDQQSEVSLEDIQEDFQSAVDNAYTVFDRGRTDINQGFDRNRALLDRNFNRQKIGFENRLDDLRGVARRHRGDTEGALSDLMLRNEQTLRSRLISAGLQGNVANTARTFERLEQAERTANVRQDFQSSIQQARQEYDRNLGIATEDFQTAGQQLAEDKETGLTRNQEDYDSQLGSANQSRYRNLRNLRLAEHAQQYLFDEEREQLDHQRVQDRRESHRQYNERIASTYNNLGQQVFNTGVQAGYDPQEALTQARGAFDQSRTAAQQGQQYSAPSTRQPGQFVPLRYRTNREESRQKGRTSNVGTNYR